MALVQEIAEKYFLASNGTKHLNYQDAYKASICHNLSRTIKRTRESGLSDASSEKIAMDIMKEFVVTLPR